MQPTDWITAIATAVLSFAVLAGAIAWIIERINGAISRTTFRAADSLVNKNMERFKESTERIIRREENASKITTVASSVVLGGLLAWVVLIFKGKGG